ncbi:MAG TPA: xanthine dehydrogenase family protein molybdopterin-binding subunit, partial [Solirubrobacteraceae bacterium]|nr:xanthine dehydrogenase family protein molybdopterin-binding subunit [Solirubrobacteraceae bacterium]
MTAPVLPRSVGTPHTRLEAREKVMGRARYAYEHHVEGMAYCQPVQATVASGDVRGVDAAPALARDGVLAVVWAENAPGLADSGDAELALFQSRTVGYRGQIVAAVIADSLEGAREAAGLVRVDYDERPHDVILRPDHPELYTPEKVNPSFPSETGAGDPDAAHAAAAVSIDATYTTPAFHNNPMEPHATVAVWEHGGLTLYDSTQGASAVARTVAKLFELEPAQVRVISPHVGGGFGSKGLPRPNVVLAAIAAKVAGRAVKVATTRQQMFAYVGYRTPTIQRLRLAADADGRLQSLSHEACEQTSRLREFAEQTAICSRWMYAAPNRRTAHRLVALDVPTPSWLRAPGECPGMYGLESGMDELAHEAGIDPVELRIINEPEVHPESGERFSSRNLVACLREGAERFGWERRGEPGARRDGRWLHGMGVASSTYPAYQMPSRAAVRTRRDGGYVVRIAAADIGTGARTVLAQIAADALEVPIEQVAIKVGDSGFPQASVAGGSSGTASWGTAVVLACRALREQLAEHSGAVPEDGLEATADTSEFLKSREQLARYAFGAQFADVRVDAHTGEVRVSRMLGVFAAGRIVNPRLARSQLIGGMTMGISMALHEESVMDPRFGDFVNKDLAQYHVAACADIESIEAHWLDETDDELNPMGSKGIGEIGIVGTAAAVANAVFNATGQRVRDLPIRLDRLVR